MASPPAHEDVDAVHDLAFHPHLASLEPDVRRVVIRARGGTPGPAHGDGSGLAHVFLEVPGQRHGARLGVDEGEIAEVRARARHEAAPHLRRVVRQLLEERLLGQVAEPRVGHVGQEHVLGRGEPELPLPVRISEPGQLVELVRRDAAHGRLQPDVVEPRLALTEDADVIAVRCPARVAARPGQPAHEPRLQLRAKARRPPLAEQEGEPRLAPGLAGAMVAEDEGDGRARIRRLLRAHEDVEGLRHHGAPRSLLAPHRDVEARRLHAVEIGHRRRHRDVLRLPARAVLAAPGDGDVELSRQVGELLVAEEAALELAGDRHRVDELARGEAGGRAADDAADIVHPRLEARQPRHLEAPHDLGHPLHGDPAELELLPRGDIGDGPPRLARELGEQAHLRGAHHAVRHANAHHGVSGRRAAHEDPHPLEALLVVLADGLPSFPGEADEIVLDLQAVLLRLERLDLVHRRASASGRMRTAQALSSGCFERGSRADRVRLLAAL